MGTYLVGSMHGGRKNTQKKSGHIKGNIIIFISYISECAQAFVCLARYILARLNEQNGNKKEHRKT